MRVHNKILENLRESLREPLDEENLEEWTHIGGPRRKTMDNRHYQLKIMSKLIPMLNKYGIEMTLYPTVDEPGYQVYNGYIGNDRIDFKFINSYKPTQNYREGKYDMTVKIYFRGKEETAGVIDLKNESSIDAAFGIITQALENLGAIGDKPVEEPKEETNSELDDLANFKNSLNEQELLEIEVE